MKNVENTHLCGLEFCSNAQSEAVTSACGEISQKSALKRENVGDVSTPMLIKIKFLKVVLIKHLC